MFRDLCLGGGANGAVVKQCQRSEVISCVRNIMPAGQTPPRMAHHSTQVVAHGAPVVSGERRVGVEEGSHVQGAQGELDMLLT